MSRPDPLIVSWRGRQLRVRHDDPHLGQRGFLEAVAPASPMEEIIADDVVAVLWR